MLRKKKRAALVAAIAVVIVAAAAAAVFWFIGRGPDAEKIFSRKYAEYAGGTQAVQYVGENLDGTDGMLLYAQGVVEISSDGGRNTVVSADAESRQYTFENPSEELASLQAGSVFFVVPGEGCPEGITAKVDRIEQDGTRLTVYGGELALDELFEYVNLSMDLAMPEFTYDPAQLEEGAEISFAGTDEQDENLPLSAVRPQAGVVPLSGGTDAAQWDTTMNTGIVLSRSANIQIGSPSGNLQHNAHYSGQYTLEIRTVRVLFRYDSTEGFFGAGVWVDYRTGTESSVELEGTYRTGKDGEGSTWPVLTANIPGTPLFAKINCYVVSELSGRLSGSLSQTESRTAGFTFEMTSRGSAPHQYNELNGKSSEISADIEGTIQTTFGIKGTIGVPFLAEAFLDVGAGAQAEGKLDLLSAGSEEHPDEIHDCRKCIDGDASLVLQLRAGVDATLLEHAVGKKVGLSWDLAELKQKIGDFYASYRDGQTDGPECGTGECPHRSYRVEVSVVKPSGVKADFAQVTARYPDLRTYTMTTDAGGKGELYLPSGDNQLTATHSGLRGSTRVIVEDRPTQATIKLDETEKKMYICYSVSSELKGEYTLQESFACPELETALKSMFPQAEWINRRDPVGGGTSHLGFLELSEMYEWVPGDIVLFVDVSKSAEIRVGQAYGWVEERKWPTDTVHEPCDYVYGMELSLYQVLRLPSENGDDSQDRQSYCQLYSMECRHKYDWNSLVMPGEGEMVCYFPMTSSAFESTGLIVTSGGLQYDASYTVTGQEPAVTYEWDYEEAAPQFSTLLDMAHGCSSISAGLAQKAYEIYPYVELLEDGDWFDKIEELTQGGIEVS